MAIETVYSNTQKNSSSASTKVRVEYEGTRGTATLVLILTGGAYVGESNNPLTFTFGGASTTIPMETALLTKGEHDIVSVSFPVSLDGGTYTGQSTLERAGEATLLWSGSATIPAHTDPAEEKPIAATLEQWQDLASRIKNAEEGIFTDSEWNNMWS